MKKGIVFACIAVVILLLAVFGRHVVRWLFSQQYNSNGISHFLVITIDKRQPMTYVGTLENHDVYIERLDLNGTVFRSVEAKNVSLKEAFENQLVSIDEWRNFARRTKREGDTEILQFQNYEIAVTDETCLIRPII